MKRTFLIPFVSAVLGGGVVVAVVAVSGGFDESKTAVTTVQSAPPRPVERLATDAPA